MPERFDGPDYDEYLGDGCYALFDGYSIWLDCRAQPEMTPGPKGVPGIALEPAVLAALDRYREKLKRHFAETATA